MQLLEDETNDGGKKKAEEYLEKLGTAFHFDCYKDKKPEGCHQFAEYLSVVKKDPEKSAQLFQKTCEEMQFGDSCWALGNMYLIGRGVEKDFSKAYSLFVQSCDLGSMGGCNNAGLVAQNGHQAVQPDGKTAEGYFKRACDGDFKNGCFNLSILYLQGKHVEKDMGKALEYSLKSCQLGHPWGCGNASRILKTGDGVPKDEKKGEELLKRAKELMKT